jgi:hypothetical protein
LLKIVKATHASAFFSIFDPIMRKYVFAILLVFVFMQPLVSKALVYNNTPFSINAHTERSISKSTPTTPGLLMENFIAELEDEDEFSDSYNLSSVNELLVEKQFGSIKYNAVNASIHLNGYLTPYSIASKPLYILWSVFRI